MTEAGGAKLEEPLVVRPTSEAAIWNTYAGWIHSHPRPAPALQPVGQRGALGAAPRLFLRTTEFLWQEGHTAHETAEQALAECLIILHQVYADCQQQVLAMPVLRGRKSARERFPGAVETFTTEAMMRDRKALQAATSHYLGDEFARAYGVAYTGRDGARHHPFATSWGASSRLVGGLIMTHGDDRGLRLPPAVAPHQVVVVPIGDGGRVGEAAVGLCAQLREAGLRVRLDDREHLRPGAKFYEWELKGVPLRIELGERELASGLASIARRDQDGRAQLALEGAATAVRDLLDDVQQRLFESARDFRDAHTMRFTERAELFQFLEQGRGFAVTPWCGGEACEAEVKGATSATIRCLTLEPEDPGAACAVCGRPGTETATWAQAY